MRGNSEPATRKLPSSRALASAALLGISAAACGGSGTAPSTPFQLTAVDGRAVPTIIGSQGQNQPIVAVSGSLVASSGPGPCTYILTLRFVALDGSLTTNRFTGSAGCSTNGNTAQATIDLGTQLGQIGSHNYSYTR